MTRRIRNGFYRLLPDWLIEGEGERVWYSLTLMMDGYLERLYQGVLARFPEYAPKDALPYLGRDRKIIRGIEEPDASYVARLLKWLDYHRTRGNPFALMEQIRAYCQADVRVRTVDRRGNWYTIDRDGTYSYKLNSGNWNWDAGGLDRWARFWVIIYPTAANEPWGPAAQWGDPTLWTSGLWGKPGATIGTTATVDQVTDVRRIVAEWKPAGTKCEWIVIAFDDASFNPNAPEPDGNWGDWSKLVVAAKRASRLSTARYWKGS